MERGTIFRNHKLHESDPGFYCVYVGQVGRLANVLELRKDKLIRARYLYEELKEDADFEVVGYTEGFDVIQADLTGFISHKSDTIT